jgi:hypothetical protein
MGPLKPQQLAMAAQKPFVCTYVWMVGSVSHWCAVSLTSERHAAAAGHCVQLLKQELQMAVARAWVWQLV